MRITIDIVARGNLVPDAPAAALTRTRDIRPIDAHDRDFRKFPFLKVVDPASYARLPRFRRSV